MNKNKTISKVFVVSLSVAVCLFSCFIIGCGTSVSLSYWEPAEVDMNGYTGIGVQSTKPASVISSNYHVEKRFDSNIPVPYFIQNMRSHLSGNENTVLASEVTSLIEKGLNQGVYKVVNSTTVNTLVQQAQLFPLVNLRELLMKQKVDVLITSVINNMNYEEFITCSEKVDKTGVKIYRYYLNQCVSVSLTYYVQDVNDVYMIYSDTLNVSYPSSESMFGIGGRYKETLLGEYDPVTNVFTRSDYSIPEPKTLFASAIGNFSEIIKNKLTPHMAKTNIQLMENKAKVASIENAYKLVDNGYYNQALVQFLDEWNRSLYLPAGYNAAVMYLGMGDYDSALEMSLEVYQKTGNSQAYSLYDKINSLIKSQSEAYSQMPGSQESQTDKGSGLVVF